MCHKQRAIGLDILHLANGPCSTVWILVLWLWRFGEQEHTTGLAQRPPVWNSFVSFHYNTQNSILGWIHASLIMVYVSRARNSLASRLKYRIAACPSCKDSSPDTLELLI